MAKYRSEKFAQQKRKTFFSVVVLVFLSFVLFVLVLSAISRLNFLNIQKIEINGNKKIADDVLAKIVGEKIVGKYWFLFSKKNIFLFPDDEIRDDILGRFSAVKAVDFNLFKINNLMVDIKEREYYAIWCGSDDNCFFIDEEGYAFEKNTIKQEGFVEFYFDNEKVDLLRQSILPKEKFKEVDDFIKFVSGSGLKPFKLVIVKNNSKRELYFGNNAKIIFDEKQDLKDVMSSLQSVLNLEGFDSQKIEYLDLRFGNKVFYK